MGELLKSTVILFLSMALIVSVFSIKKPSAEQGQQHIAQTVVQTSIKESDVKRYLSHDELSELYTCSEEIRNDTCIEVSIEEAEILMKIAVLEDYTDEISQAYIMSLILNRVNSPDFPNTIKEVVEQDGQFMKLTDKRYINAQPDVNSHLALALIESGQIQTEYLFYEAIWVKNSWASRHRKEYEEYGGSRFYK